MKKIIINNTLNYGWELTKNWNQRYTAKRIFNNQSLMKMKNNLSYSLINSQISLNNFQINLLINQKYNHIHHY